MNIKDLFGKLKDTQKLFGDIQKQLENEKVEGSAGGGLVKITMNGLQEVTEVYIDRETIRMKDRELLQDLIKSAINQAREKAAELSQKLLTEQVKESAFNLPNIFSKNKEE